LKFVKTLPQKLLATNLTGFKNLLGFELFHRHSDFLILLILFITFRVLALVAFRPGGLVLDFSDFYWYRSFAELTRQGYYPYYNLWTTYPPLFPFVMIALYQISTLLPPWTFPNLWFTLLLGGFFLLFEIGNFILLYLFALKIYPQKSDALRPCWIYAMFFVPVYTVTGWFESYPLFFFLLSLYLLLEKRPYLSALFTGIGFMIKLIPAILIPVALQQIWQSELRPIRFWKPYRSGLIYLTLFALTVLLIGLPFYLLNPALIFGSQQITAARAPWETVWALIDGNYDYGVIPLDMRDLSWTPKAAPPTHIPWLLVTAIFGLIYSLVYFRPFDWHNPRQVVAFVAFTNALFMLWSKGYSPQWLGWPLYFIALLIPNLRGILYATLLSLGNIIEANFFFIMFPAEHWLFAVTILTRTMLLIILAGEFLGLIWLPSPRVVKMRTWGLTALVIILLLGLIPAIPQLGRTYFEVRLQQSPYRATISRLQKEKVKGALLLNSQTTYDWFYPYLRNDYQLFMLDDYAPPGQSVEQRTTALLNTMVRQTDVLWIYDANAAETTPAEKALTDWLKPYPTAHQQDIDGGRLYLFIIKP